ncbi:MAG: hypothetical protein ACRD1M_06825 [Terriglobales bacterium]
MATTMQTTNELAAAIAEAFAQRQGMMPAAPQAQGWAPVAAPAPVAAHGLLVPLKLQTPAGTVRCYLQLGPEAATPQGAQAAITALMQMGAPLDAWQPRETDGNGGGGWGRGGGGWAGRGGNGWGGGGGYGRGWGRP